MVHPDGAVFFFDDHINNNLALEKDFYDKLTLMTMKCGYWGVPKNAFL